MKSDEFRVISPSFMLSPASVPRFTLPPDSILTFPGEFTLNFNEESALAISPADFSVMSPVALTALPLPVWVILPALSIFTVPEVVDTVPFMPIFPEFVVASEIFPPALIYLILK